MPHLLKNTSKSLRISLILILLAAGFATHAYAAIGTDSSATSGPSGNAFYRAYMSKADPVKIGDSKYKLQFGVNFESLQTIDTEFTTAFLMRFPDGIKVDSFEVKAAPGSPEMPRQNVYFIFDNITKWETVTLTPAMRQDLVRFSSYKTLRVNADGGNSYRPPLLMGNLPAGAKYSYQISLETTITNSYTRTSNEPCYGRSDLSETNGFVMGTATGLGATPNGPSPGGAVANIFSNIHAACEEVPAQNTAPVITTVPVTVAPTPEVETTTPPVTVPETPPVVESQTSPIKVVGSGGVIPPKGALDPALAPVGVGAPGPEAIPPLAQNPEGQPALQPVAQEGSQPNNETIPESADAADTILGTEPGLYSPEAASGSKNPVSVDGSSGSDSLDGLLTTESPSSSSSSQNVQYAIAGLLVLGALTALAAGKKLGRPGMVAQSGTPVKETRVSLSAVTERDIPMDASTQARLYNSQMTFVDIDVHERELELVGASSISSGANAAQRRTNVFDPTHEARQAFPARVWNELVKRCSTEKITK